jgi:hypothetical protein
MKQEPAEMSFLCPVAAHILLGQERSTVKCSELKIFNLTDRKKGKKETQ